MILRRVGWSPEEKLAGSIALSLLVLYLCSFVIYIVGLPPACQWVVTAGAALAALWTEAAIRRLFADHETRSSLTAYAFFVAWSIGLVALIRNYSGGYWGGDWFEHYQRALFFLNHWPQDTKFLGLYWLPARPPLMNLVCAHFLAQAGQGFGSYQMIVTLLSSLFVLPALLIARHHVFPRLVDPRILTAFLVLNPMLVENATVPWTKLLTAFFVLLAIHFYISGTRRSDASRLVFSFVAVTAGILTHYSAAPYAIFLGLHYLFVGVRRRRWGVELPAILLTTALFVGPWFGWATATYGARMTFASNTTVTEVPEFGRVTASEGRGMSLGPRVKIAAPTNLALGERLSRVARNVRNTIIPHPLRTTAHPIPPQENRWGYVRDFAFLIYQTNIVFAFGSAGGLLLVYRLLATKGRSRESSSWIFWSWLTVFAVVVGIAVCGVDDDFGLAHVCLQPIVVLGLVLLASTWKTWPRAVKLVAVAGLLFDLMIGILLQFEIQATTLGKLVPQPGGGWIVEGEGRLSIMTYVNWIAKQTLGLQFLGDQAEPLFGLIVGALSVLLAFVLLPLVRDLAAPPTAPG